MDNNLKKYPYLKKELEEKKKMISLTLIDEEEAKLLEDDFELEEEEEKTEINTNSDPNSLIGFIPTAIDFIRRCDTKEQAIEIINYLLKRGELNTIDASKLKKQLSAKGLRSFGSKKDAGFYFNQTEK